jgi:ketosteroid isomerase-like protein
MAVCAATLVRATVTSLRDAFHKKCRELVEYFETMAAHVRPEAFRDVVFTASDDRVVAEGSNDGAVVATGERYEHDWVMVFTIRDGEVQWFRHFYDPRDIEAAMGE